MRHEACLDGGAPVSLPILPRTAAGKRTTGVGQRIQAYVDNPLATDDVQPLEDGAVVVGI